MVFLQWLAMRHQDWLNGYLEFYITLEVIIFFTIPIIWFWMFMSWLKCMELFALLAEWDYLRRVSRDKEALVLYAQLESRLAATNWLFRKTLGRYFSYRLAFSIGYFHK